MSRLPSTAAIGLSAARNHGIVTPVDVADMVFDRLTCTEANNAPSQKQTRLSQRDDLRSLRMPALISTSRKQGGGETDGSQCSTRSPSVFSPRSDSSSPTSSQTVTVRKSEKLSDTASLKLEGERVRLRRNESPGAELAQETETALRIPKLVQETIVAPPALLDDRSTGKHSNALASSILAAANKRRSSDPDNKRRSSDISPLSGAQLPWIMPETDESPNAVEKDLGASSPEAINLSAVAPPRNRRKSEGSPLVCSPARLLNLRRNSAPCAPERVEEDSSNKNAESMDRTARVNPSDPELCERLARRHGLSAAEVKQKHLEFCDADTNGNGFLSKSEFELFVCRAGGKREDNASQWHVLNRQWTALVSLSRKRATPNLIDTTLDEVSFEDFLLWSSNCFDEAVLVTKEERLLRKLTRNRGWNVLEAEKARDAFRSFDLDGSGSIDLEEFRHALAMLMSAKNVDDISGATLRRYFSEIDTDSSGDIDLREFLEWYFSKWINRYI